MRPDDRRRRRSLLSTLPAVALAAIALAPSRARADGGDAELPRLILETGRVPVAPAEEDLVRLQIHGEYQVRYTRVQSYPLDVSASVRNDHPGAISDSLGQNDFAAHWLRITPRLQIKDTLEIVGQMDVLTGLVIGDLAHDSFADHTPRDRNDGFANVQPRWLYLSWLTKYGLWRVGQQPSHWGLGLVANDGDHPSLFGDYRYGSISDAILFATKPMGKDGPLTVAAAGQLVYRDNTARITRGDHAFQGVLAGYWERGPNQIGLYGVYRHQSNDRSSGSELFPYTDTIDAWVIDAAGKFAAPVAGSDAIVFGGAEAALILGATNAIRSNAQAEDGTKTTLRSYGGAVQLGVAHRSVEGPQGEAGKKAPSDWGDAVGQIEIGYASGDADPYDGTERRFLFDPNHKVGLVLFDEVLRFATARAASAAQDPLLARDGRPTPGVDLLPSNGGVFGAQYINPTAVIRPRRWLDLKAGMVIAQTTADLVDPYRLALSGAYVNYRGGDPRRHDLGVEVDLGTEARFPLDYAMSLALGAQGGVLFPGGAFADAGGARMKTPWIFVARAALMF